jgi:hypothetical protein
VAIADLAHELVVVLVVAIAGCSSVKSVCMKPFH